MPKADPLPKEELKAADDAAFMENLARIGHSQDIETLLAEIKQLLQLCLAELRRML